MKTSLYYLLKGNIQLSLYYHALLIPTLICGILCMLKPEKRKMILIIWCTLMIVYYIYRMILYFPNSPMIYSKNNLIYLYKCGIIKYQNKIYKKQEEGEINGIF